MEAEQEGTAFSSEEINKQIIYLMLMDGYMTMMSN